MSKATGLYRRRYPCARGRYRARMPPSSSVVNPSSAPLDYKDPERLVTLLHRERNPVAAGTTSIGAIRLRPLRRWPRRNTGRPASPVRDSPERLWDCRSRRICATMLGVEPELGRVFQPGEESRRASRRRDRAQIMAAAIRREARRTGHSDDAEWTGLHDRRRDAPSFQSLLSGDSCGALGAGCHGAPRAQSGGNSLRVFARLKQALRWTGPDPRWPPSPRTWRRQYPGTNRGLQVTLLSETVTGRFKRLY